MLTRPAREPLDTIDHFLGARKAASVIPLRDTENGMEVLMLRRAERDGDMRSGACVFPGGVVDARDAQAYGFCDGMDDAQASAQLGLEAGGLSYWVAAVRECFEEVGLGFVSEPASASVASAIPAAALAGAAWRERLQSGEAGAAQWAQASGLRLRVGALVYYSHWLTPPGHPKRFDTRFFIARAPQDQEAQADMGEAVELMWLRPAQALERERGLKLLPVTRVTLAQLARYASVDDALSAVRSQGSLPLVMPRAAQGAKGLQILLPEEPAYAEVAKLDPTGHQQAHATIVPGRVVELSARVRRLTAPNPGMMTGPGTNSYLVCEPLAADADPAGGEWTLIDPGPDDETHRQALLAAVQPGRIVRILVTHTHKDHSPGAMALATITGAQCWGLLARHPQGQDSSFVPARQPGEGERLSLGPSTHLRALHTPGHASNHVCWLLEEEGMLFTGDHVMQGSTVVINPPDGDMAAYLAALQRLQALPLQWLAPGHGFLVAEPARAIQALIEHRLKREAKVVAAVQRRPGSLAELVMLAYDDVPVGLHALAQRSLLAHLLKLQADGRVSCVGDDWLPRPGARDEELP
jgi:glyoxylase-like metal-dependent hydrolase (beta-lactamase superfamily II)/8-oxo-dGTP pyrophosphatase MutT (NUDIX family)